MKTLLTILALAVALGSTSRTMALTSAEGSNILFMKQEEKMARDVYQALHAKWGHATFANIAEAEQRHMEAVDSLIRRYGLTDPTPAEPGRFSIPEIQSLYEQAIERGGASLPEALAVGVLIEETDIADLRETLAVAVERPVRQVMSNLLRASGHHLQAFQSSLDRLNAGVSVSPSASCPAGNTPRCVSNGDCGQCPAGSGRGGRGAGGPGGGRRSGQP